MGARLIFHCLLELQRQGASGLVEHAVLLGTPVSCRWVGVPCCHLAGQKYTCPSSALLASEWCTGFSVVQACDVYAHTQH
jgi:hypothetical protein